MKNFFVALFAWFVVMNLSLVAAPVITSVNPNRGPDTGGTVVTIIGSGFTGATAVDFGTEPATLFVVNSDTSITAIAPVQVFGGVYITVTAPSGASSPSFQSAYAYQGGWRAFVGTAVDGVIPIDVATNTSEPTLLAGLTIPRVATDPLGKNLYGLDSNNNLVQVIDLATNTVTAPIAIPAGSLNLAVTPDGQTLYVLIPTGIVPVDLTTNTAGPVIPFGTNLNDFAITPNGQTIYGVDVSTNSVIPLDIATGIPGTPIPVGPNPLSIAITPDGTKAYVVGIGDNFVTPIDLTTNTPGPGINVGFATATIAIAADGLSAYVANNSSFRQIIVPTDTPGTLLNFGSTLIDIAVTPDSLTAYVTDLNGDAIYPIDLSTFTVGTPIPANTAIPVGIIITPDQAPIASFVSQSPGIFDASLSVSPVGTITSYFWDFGDGQTLTTTTPIVSHNYAVPGNYTVTLTVTNSAGTSTIQTYTGQMVSQNGGPFATASQTFFEGSSSPIAFEGRLIKNKFATQTDIIHQLQWLPSSDPSTTSYLLFRNGVLIAQIPSSGPFCYNDHNRNPKITETYTLTTINALGQETSRTSFTFFAKCKNSIESPVF